MGQLLGEYIRQLRRERRLTQTELGGEHFSKSYVSAIEREQITPTAEALRFFAEQLGLPSDALTLMSQQLKQGEQNISPIPYHDNTHSLSPNLIATLPTQHASSPIGDIFLRGIAAQQQGDISTALSMLEATLGMASPIDRPIVLDALGTNYALGYAYPIALNYHQRAYRLLLEQEQEKKGSIDTLFSVELHCANDCRALGLHERACMYYKLAHKHLLPSQSMKAAGELYAGLGYCTYASYWQHLHTDSHSSLQTKPKDFEQQSKAALEFLEQSSTVYLLGGDQEAVVKNQLICVMILLEFGTYQRGYAHTPDREIASSSTISPFLALFKKAEEQCRNILLTCTPPRSSITPSLGRAFVTTTIAYIIRGKVQRAALARLDGESELATQELAKATGLYQQLLDTLTEPAIPAPLIEEALTELDHFPDSQVPFSNNNLEKSERAETPVVVEGFEILSHAELYFAIAEALEERALLAATDQETASLYTQANAYFLRACSKISELRPESGNDPSYITRMYRATFDLLLERQKHTPFSPQTAQTLNELLRMELAHPSCSFPAAE